MMCPLAVRAARRLVLPLCICCLLCQWGCGGGGASPSSTTAAKPRITIGWAARSRDVAAPSSALSVNVILQKASAAGSDFSFQENRRTTPAAYSEEYTAPSAAKVGTWTLVVDFYSETNATGSVVGVATASVTIDKNGIGIGTVATTGTIASVALPAGQTIAVGQQTDLVVNASDSSGNLIAVTPGSVFYTIASGGSSIQLASNGQLSGTAPGAASIVATIDNVASAPQTVTVVPVITLTVSPIKPIVAVGAAQQFTASVTGTTATAVDWSVKETNGGSIASTGSDTAVYTAGQISGTFHVVATLHSDASKTAQATITVPPPTNGIFIADQTDDTITSMLDLGGAGIVQVGTRGSGANQFSAVTYASVGGDGRVYAADSGNNRIARVDDLTQPATWIAVGSKGTGIGEFNNPKSVVAAETSGGVTLYVADTNNNRIVSFQVIGGAIDTSTWRVISAPPSGVSGPALHLPGGVFIDPAGHLYVADTGNDRIVYMHDISGSGWTAYGHSGIGTPAQGTFNNPQCVVVGADGKLYIADTNNHRIVRIDDMTGANWIMYGSQGTGQGQFNGAASVFVASSGTIYVADEFNSRVVSVTDMQGHNWTAYQKPNGASAHGTTIETPVSVWVR